MKYDVKLIGRSTSRATLGITLYIGIALLQAFILLNICKFVNERIYIILSENDGKRFIKIKTKEGSSDFSFYLVIIAFVVWNNIISNLHKIVYGALELLAGDELSSTS